MQFSEFTPEQQQSIAEFTRLVRSNMALTSKAINQMAQYKQLWTTTISPLVSQLDADSEISDDTGLAGAVKLLKDDLDIYIQSITGILQAFNTDAQKARFVRAIGLVNSIQTV